MKKCSLCKEEKLKTEFHKSTSAPDGYNYYCKECNKLHANKYREGHRDLINERQMAVRKAKPVDYIYQRAKSRARKGGLEFNIEISDIIIPEYCPLTGIKIVIEVGRGKQRDCPALDRIDNTKGYVKGNVRVVSDLGNRMKSDASKAELLEFSKRIIGYISNEITGD